MTNLTMLHCGFVIDDECFEPLKGNGVPKSCLAAEYNVAEHFSQLLSLLLNTQV